MLQPPLAPAVGWLSTSPTQERRRQWFGARPARRARLDGILEGAFTQPNLTTIAPDKQVLARTAIDACWRGSRGRLPARDACRTAPPGRPREHRSPRIVVLIDGEVIAMRRWQPAVAVAAVTAGLLLVGHLTAPPATAPAATPPLVDAGPSCDPDGITRRQPGPAGGPQLHPPIARLQLAPAGPRQDDLEPGRAEALARELVGHDADGITTHARLLWVARPPGFPRTRAWVVAVTGVPAGLGYCGPVGSREVVVVLDPVTGRELWRYGYR
jgi:hypothetical protein